MVAAKEGGNVLDVLREHGVTNIVEYPSYEKIVEAARDGKVRCLPSIGLRRFIT